MQDDPIVKHHLEREQEITSDNVSNALWLEKLMSVWLEWDEGEKALKCWEIYRDYPDILRMSENGGIVWHKKRKGFAKKA